MIIRISFPGYYQTLLQDELDMQAEYYELEEESINWLATHEAVAEEYAKEYLRQMGLEGKFDSLVSPKYYNFETDALFVELPNASLLKIKLEVMLDNREDFSAWVIDNCTSRDGFISFLPNNLALWPEDWESGHYYAALEFLDEGSEDIIEALRANGQMEIITRSDNS